MDLVDEALEFGDGVAALFGSHTVIDGQCHRFGGRAHLADSIFIGLGSDLIVVDEHGTKFSGYPFGSLGLLYEGQEFLLALLLVGNPYRLPIGEREAPFADLRPLLFV